MTPYVMKKQMSKYLGHTCSNSTACSCQRKSCAVRVWSTPHVCAVDIQPSTLKSGSRFTQVLRACKRRTHFYVAAQLEEEICGHVAHGKSRGKDQGEMQSIAAERSNDDHGAPVR